MLHLLIGLAIIVGLFAFFPRATLSVLGAIVVLLVVGVGLSYLPETTKTKHYTRQQILNGHGAAICSNEWNDLIVNPPKLNKEETEACAELNRRRRAARN